MMTELLPLIFLSPINEAVEEMLGDDVISQHPLLHPFHRQTDSATDGYTHGIQEVGSVTAFTPPS